MAAVTRSSKFAAGKATEHVKDLHVVDAAAARAPRPTKTRVTEPYMTVYEKARMLGARALQLSLDSPPLVDVGDETDPLIMAEMELAARKLPVVVRRYLPDGSHEDWAATELEPPQ